MDIDVEPRTSDAARTVEAAGGTVFSKPQSVVDNDAWYGGGFADPDGHKWNVFFNGG